jgi:phytoene dehydrogenase-like protein
VRTYPEFDVVIVGGGHNGLVASCYLGKAGMSVAVLEQNDSLGGATVSRKVFPDFDVRLSTYSYLVSLLPDQIVEELGLNFSTISRSIASFTPDHSQTGEIGLLISSELDERTAANFRLISDESDWKQWQLFYAQLKAMAEVLAPTLLQPLPTRSGLREAVDGSIWDDVIEYPLGRTLEERFKSDLVRGIVLTDGLIGTFADAHSFYANQCFLYHLIGNGSGQWKVPLGGMGKLITELKRVAGSMGVQFFTSTKVLSIAENSSRYKIETNAELEFESRYVLANCAPQVLAQLLGDESAASLDGSQVKLNMLLTKLPRLKSGIDPELAFAGTFHLDERYSDLQLAFKQSSQGQIPDRIPAEMYCHTLTDPSILSPKLQREGFHTLTMFALHTPASLFDTNHDEVKDVIVAKLLSQLNEYLLDPIEECLATAEDGSWCLEAKSPLELEVEIGLPRGNIFHKDLSFPFREDHEPVSWGVETSHPGIFICGAGAIRGGGVSGIPGHNAAAAVLALESALKTAVPTS